MPKKRNSSTAHKKLVGRRKMREEKHRQEDFLNRREQILTEYNAGSEVFPMPTLVEALAEQKILQSTSFLKTQSKILEWFNSEVEQRAEQTNALNYLPDKIISFSIPLDFYLPLPENYISGFMVSPDNKLLEANCVTNTTRIIHIGRSAVKVTYLVVSLCSDEVAKDIETKTSNSFLRNFERAILVANSVIASFQAIPSRHNHFLHQINSLSCPSKVEFFIFNRRTKQILKKSYQITRDSIFSEAFQSRPLDKDELSYYQNCHVRETFSDDKIFNLVAIINQATNARCFGLNDDAILYADKFANFSLGYLYCEVRILQGEDRRDVYEDYAKKDEKKIFNGLWQILHFADKETFKIAIGYDDWYEKCHLRRNGLNHRFLTGGFNGKESEDALYYSAEMVRKACEIVIKEFDPSHPDFMEKFIFLRDATLFPKNMHEFEEKSREKLLSI